ncbi:hypothetical protein PMAYCL1PPCAC_28117, partial [Pristionchus mayeri]
VFAGLDGRSKRMQDIKRRKRRGAGMEEEAKEKKNVVPYMQPRDGFVIVRQSTNFRCTVCGECDFPTLSSIVYHLRRVHSNLQLSQIEHWIHCAGCGYDTASLTGLGNHMREAAGAAAAAGTTPSCSLSTAFLCWQAEKDSEEATRFLAGLDPVPPSSGASSTAAEIKDEMIDEDDVIAPNTVPQGSSKKRKHNQRVDKRYILPRPGYTIIRRQHVLVCQLCGDGGFATCSSLDHHLRKVHKAGVHQAGMWMHCKRCGQDFCNISSVRSHVANEGDPESCGWVHVFMCWHEPDRRSANGDEDVKAEPMDEGMDPSDWPSTSYQGRSGSHGFNSTPKRYRKLFKPPTHADEGFVIVRRNTDLPCFGCTFRAPSLSTLSSHMPTKHKLSYSDVGAWMTCACGREFTSTTAMGDHVREKGEMGCSRDKVVLCWQHRIGGRETETPCFAGVYRSARVDPASLPVRAQLPMSTQGSLRLEPTTGWVRDDGEEEERMRNDYNNGLAIPPADDSHIIKEEVFDDLEEASSSNSQSDKNDQLLPRPPPSDDVQPPQRDLRRSDRPRQPPPRYLPQPGSSDAILDDLKSKMVHREAEVGWITAKQRTNLPCFGCELRFLSLSDFCHHMKHEHQLHLWDIGAWLECRCEREFLSDGTGLRQHIQNEGAETGCSINHVALCWKHAANRETETPCYSHYVANKPAFVHQTSRQPVITASSVHDHQRVKGKRSGPIFAQSERVDQRAIQKRNGAAAAVAALVEAVPGREITSADLFASSAVPDDFEVKEEEMDFTEGDGHTVDGPGSSGIIKEEELFLSALNQIGRATNGGEKDENEKLPAPKRMATFDPTGYEDEDRFVLRKTKQMACRSCGMNLDNPSVLAVHLRTVHAAEMSGLRRDWYEQQWLECVACKNVFHAADDHEEHLRSERRCTMADARLCWMEKMEG